MLADRPMISTKGEYLHYLACDQKALGRRDWSVRTAVRQFFFPDYIWRFQKLLRKSEYVKNCRRGIVGKLENLYLQWRFQKMSVKLGFSIPLNVFGPGLAIVHYGTIVVNPNAQVGENCRIHPSTCIGASGGSDKAPQIGDNVYIGPGVKIYGDIRIGSNIAIAANSAVNKSFKVANMLIGGVPAHEIKSVDISRVIKHISKLEEADR